MHIKYFILASIGGLCSGAMEARFLRLRSHRSATVPAQESKKNPLRDVMIVAKRSRDFDYLPGIICALQGQPYAPNRGAGGREQRYVIRGNGGGERQRMGGVYAVVVLNESLKNWMGHATLTLEYLRCGSSKRQSLCLPLDVRGVVDDRQIFIFLDPLAANRRKFLAWKATLCEGERPIRHSKASLSWEIFLKER
jgi:hypothetical protein